MFLLINQRSTPRMHTVGESIDLPAFCDLTVSFWLNSALLRPALMSISLLCLVIISVV
jgi:hypothetical protein